MPFGDGTTPFFSGNPQSGYPTPPPSWTRLNYGPVPAGPSSSCPLPKLDGSTISNKYDDCFQQASQNNSPNIDWRVLKALAVTESGENFDNIGKPNSLYQGVMQVKTNGDLGIKHPPSDIRNNPCLNIDIGTKDFISKWKRSGNLRTAFANFKGFNSFPEFINHTYKDGTTGAQVYRKFQDALTQLTGGASA